MMGEWPRVCCATTSSRHVGSADRVIASVPGDDLVAEAAGRAARFDSPSSSCFAYFRARSVRHSFLETIDTDRSMMGRTRVILHNWESMMGDS